MQTQAFGKKEFRSLFTKSTVQYIYKVWGRGSRASGTGRVSTHLTHSSSCLHTRKYWSVAQGLGTAGLDFLEIDQAAPTCQTGGGSPRHAELIDELVATSHLLHRNCHSKRGRAVRHRPCPPSTPCRAPHLLESPESGEPVSFVCPLRHSPYFICRQFPS